MFLLQIISLALFTISGPYGFVLLSSAPVNAGIGSTTARDTVFQVGKLWQYRMETTVLLNSIDAVGDRNNVGFQIESDLIISSIWTYPDQSYHKLLKLDIVSPKLLIKSRKAPEPDGFVQHSSKLDTINNYPIYISWNSGNINKIYVDQRETVSLLNLKKGVASLLQFKLLDGIYNESDASGNCNAIYSSIDPHSFSKTKLQCQENIERKQINYILSNTVKSQRQATYQLNIDNNQLNSIIAQELHDMFVTIRSDVGCKLHTIQKLKFIKSDNVQQFDSSTIQGVLKKIETSSGSKLQADTLQLQKDNLNTVSAKNLMKTIKETREWLTDEKLGGVKSASAFLKLINSIRLTNRDDIVKVLKHSRNKDILLQLFDAIGFAQTDSAHDAAMKVLQFDDDDNLDAIERYLWALSISPNPSVNAIDSLLKIANKDNYIKNVKVQETILLTLGAMAQHLAAYQPQNKIINKVKESLLNGLNYCKKDIECSVRYLRALQNLQHPSTITKLIEYIQSGVKATSVVAMKALRSFPKIYWSNNTNVLKLCDSVFYNKYRPYDSSVRTMALDTILESNPDNSTLKQLIDFLISNDGAFEVKQYLLQRLYMISAKDPQFEQQFQHLLRESKHVYNYNVMAQKGLSTAFTRHFANNPLNNGSLVTIQEINGGILKRGIVDVVLEHNKITQEMFRLGLFAGGLSSFVSSSDSDNDYIDPANDPDEQANAGMEITVLGVQIRPFIFFSGQGELMGHVWSGTASEKTPAFQALILLHDHVQQLNLGIGIISQYNSLGGTSFDLSGHIQLSLWNRNAHSWVEKNAGILLNGLLQIDTEFINSKVEYTLSTEPKLNLISDIDFYSSVSLCMQLRQPDTILKHNIYKVERIPGSKHKLRKSTYKVLKVPGRTYALNQKNNEMCNIIFKNK